MENETEKKKEVDAKEVAEKKKETGVILIIIAILIILIALFVKDLPDMVKINIGV
jgi:hypothetical protein